MIKARQSDEIDWVRLWGGGTLVWDALWDHPRLHKNHQGSHTRSTPHTSRCSTTIKKAKQMLR
jgi:hypothetical protein